MQYNKRDKENWRVPRYAYVRIGHQMSPEPNMCNKLIVMCVVVSAK